VRSDDDRAVTTAEAASKQRCIWVKLPSQRLMVRDFDRQVAELQVAVAVINGFTALGILVTKAAG